MEAVELMTVEELAGYLRLTQRTMYRLLKDDKLPAIKVGRQWRFNKGDIDAWLHQNSTRSSASILIVDDDEDIRSLFKDTLEGPGMTVTATGDPLEGLKLVKEQDFDLVFLDLKMPVMDGAELFKQIRAVKPDVPVTIITGYPDSELMASALSRGPLGVIQKPFAAGDIETAVHNYLRFGAHKK